MIERIDQLNAQTMREVDSYLLQAPAEAGVCFEHDPRWLSVLRKGLGHRPMALVSREAAGAPIRGYLPLALVATRLFGRFLVSLPYLNRAGIVANDAAAAAELVEEAARLAEQLNVKYLELRHGEACEHDLLGAKRDEKIRMVLDLPENEDALWKSIHSKVRNQVRKGDKFDLAIEWGGESLLDDFYAVFAVNMRDLGTPVYAAKLFRHIIAELDGQAELAVVRHEGTPIACAMLIHDDRLEKVAMTQVPSASSLRAFNHTNANMWMYFRLLARAIERGSRQFDFGRSSMDSGTFKFKKQWGAQPLPTVWQYHVRQGDIGEVRPDNPKYRRRIETWQKLPVWVTRLVGPSIVRGIP